MFLSKFLKPKIHYLLKGLQYQAAKTSAWLDKDALPNPNDFDDLSPIDNVPNAETYNQALEWALGNKRIKNIAVTGPYGSGKSSLLKTFEKSHPGYRYLNVSLASFQEEVKEVNKEEMNRLIELSIIQQMFYRVKIRAIPDSRFNRIKNLSVWRVTYLSFFTACSILGLVIILFPNALNRSDGLSALNRKHGTLMICLGIALTLPAFYNVQAYILRLINTSRFNKINLSKGEVELDPKDETSALNKHLDEMLYFFEVTKYNVVLFEDLDRFNDPEIFTKLRELNILVNQSLQISRRVIFIYAIKDNMFRDKTRTKFFDFIVPVIPVINWSNSYEIMVAKFKKKELGLTVTEKFISAVTLYIDDMRALKNIFNEFMLYKENLKGITLIQDKLLAVIIYKNIFPDDFADLHENKGTICSVFAKKSELTKSIVEQNKQLIQKNKERIGQFQERLAEDIMELRAIYLLAFQKLSPNAIAFNIKNAFVSFPDTQQNDEHFNWLTQQENIGAYHYIPNPHYGNHMRQPFASNVAFKTVEKEVSGVLSYQDRLAVIENRETAELKKLNDENQKAEQLISRLNSYSLKELFDENPAYLSSLAEDFRERKLLVYLVREGYIDENYPSLISYFYEGSLTFRDMEFILSIRNRETLAFDYLLNTIPKILERLEPRDFERRQILNFKLIDWLLRLPAVHKSKLDNIMRRLSDQSADSLKFVDEYITQGTGQQSFFKLLFDYWPAMWDFIADSATFPTDQKNKYLRLIITHADDEQLKNFNAQYKLGKYIKSLPDFLAWFTAPSDVQRIKQLIALLAIKFTKLENLENSQELFDYIIESRKYMLNEDMIRLIIMQKGADAAKNEQLIKNANYTAVQSAAFQPLLDYVEDNLPDYIEAMTLLLNSDDSEPELVKLLNKEQLSDELKFRLIDKEKAKIKLIQSVPGSLWQKLISVDKIQPVWANLIRYYAAVNTIDETLVGYLNRKSVYEELAKSRLDADQAISGDLHLLFESNWLQDNRITDSAYETLLKSVVHTYDGTIAIETLNEQKIKWLLEKLILKLSVHFFTPMKVHFSQLIGLFIAKNIGNYMAAAPDTFPLDGDDFTYLLGSPLLTPAQKGALIPRITETMLSGNIPLLNLYVPEILKSDYSVTLTVSLLIVVMGQIQENFRRQVLNSYFALFSNDEVRDLLPGLGEPYGEIIGNGETIAMKVTELDTNIAKKLKEADIIADWKGEKDDLQLMNLQAPASSESSTPAE